MAGKRDEVFLLGEEEMGSDPCAAHEAEPTETASARSDLPRLSPSWPLLVLAAVAAVVILARSGGDSADPAPQRAKVPATAAPELAPVIRTPRMAAGPRHPSSRPHHGHRRPAAANPEEPQPEPPTKAAGAPGITYAPVPEAASEPAPAATAPAPAAPLPAPRPEFGIER